MGVPPVAPVPPVASAPQLPLAATTASPAACSELGFVANKTNLRPERWCYQAAAITTEPDATAEAACSTSYLYPFGDADAGPVGYAECVYLQLGDSYQCAAGDKVLGCSPPPAWPDLYHVPPAPWLLLPPSHPALPSVELHQLPGTPDQTLCYEAVSMQDR